MSYSSKIEAEDVMLDPQSNPHAEESFGGHSVSCATNKNRIPNTEGVKHSKDDNDFLFEQQLKLRKSLDVIDSILPEDTLEQSRIDSQNELREAALKLGKMKVNLKGLSPKQRITIIRYGAQMLKYENKEEFVSEVCNAMAYLYRTGIERHIPRSMKEYMPEYKNVYEDGVAFDPRAKNMRENIQNILINLIKENGGDYSIISDYINSQRSNSWSDKSKCLKGFYLEQKKESYQNKNYYLTSHVVRDPVGEENLIKISHSIYPDRKKYAKTIAMYQAFTAIALNHIEDIPGLNKANRTLSVARGTDNYVSWGPQGILDSASLIETSSLFNLKKYNLRLDVPFCDVIFVYFLASEFCNDELAKEREIVCNLNNARTKVTESKNNERPAFIENSLLDKALYEVDEYDAI